LTEDVALRRFHENQLHPEDRYWHAVVPKSFQQQLSPKEQARQEEIFEIIASEQLYISDLELWLTVYRDPLRTQKLFPSHVLESFVKEVFSNVHEIKLRHEMLLQALFKTQRQNYRQVHSIMDDVLDTVSNAEFQRIYVDFISNIDNAIARHTRELKTNEAYAEFVSSEAATARNPRVRKLDFDHFLQRANKRLGQLKLLVDATRKKTELDHSDIRNGTLEMVLRCLHRTVMHGQAKGQGTAEQNALRTFRESLEDPPWELADLGLAHKYRAVKYEGNLVQVEPMSALPVYTVLLDNYLVFTSIIQEGSKQKRMIHKPIPLELLDAHLETGPVRTRTRLASMLGRQDSTQVVRFTIRRNGQEAMQLGARSKALAEKWIERMLEEATLRKFDIEANRPVPISGSTADVSIVAGTVFLAGKECLVIEKLISSGPTVKRWPDFSSTYTDTFDLRSRCSSGRFLAAVETEPDRILLIYGEHGCFVNGSGQPIILPRKHEWEIVPTAASYCGKNVALFSHDRVEVRNSEDGRLLQILDMPNMRLLHPLLSYSASEKVLMAAERSENGFKNLLGELLPTVNISSPILN
ncbi:hypothetical protein FRC07_000808, partial [Ceratobasidium sp. 392]